MIEVGEYIRTSRGIIGKIIRVEFDEIDKSLKWYVFLGKDKFGIEKEIYINKLYIKNHSKEPIDLIEVGDYVNGREVKHIAMFEGFPDYPKLIFVDEKHLVPGETAENKDIETILTKEQYQANCYKVGGEDETSND